MANPNPPAPPNNTGKTYNTIKPESSRVYMFKQFFLNPTSTTFWNVRGSAIRAGYSDQYASNITVQNPKWWTELKETGEYRRAKMLERAESNIDRRLSKEPETPMQEKLQHDTDKFISERLGKEHYSTRQEITDKGGKRLFSNQSTGTTDVELEDLFVGVAREKS